MMGYGWTGSCCGNGFLNIWLFIIIFVVVFFIMIVLLKNIFSGGRITNRNESKNILSASEILNERYAKGDISKKEYELMKKDLGI